MGAEEVNVEPVNKPIEHISVKNEFNINKESTPNNWDKESTPNDWENSIVTDVKEKME